MRHWLVPGLMLIAFQLRGATYYVDFDNGIDTQNGTSPITAWKHVPGDSNATGSAKSAALAAGDTILFKGGVYYRGKFSFTANGAAGDPIVYKGDGWGTGKAILDGSLTMSGTWTKCASASECGNNPNWNNIYYTYLPAPSPTMSKMTALLLNPYQDSLRLYPSYFPRPSNPFYPDVVAEYLNPQTMNTKYLIDTTLDRFGSMGLTSSYVYVHAGNNAISKTRIASYSSAEHRITFADSIVQPYMGASAHYLLANHLNAIDAAGEYYYEETAEGNGTHKFYVWPYSDPAQQSISYSTQPYGIDVRSFMYVTVEGLIIQKYAGTDGMAVYKSTSQDVSGVTIRNCRMTHIATVYSGATLYMREYDNFLFENNALYDNMFLRGVLVTGSRGAKKGENVRILNNTIERIGGTCISLNGNTRSYILNNTIINNGGIHTNGISPYQGCNNVLVANNRVFNTPRPMTFNDGTNIFIYNNILHGNDSNWVLVSWGGDRNGRVYNNLLLAAGSHVGFHMSTSSKGIDLKNNIIDGNLDPDSSTHSYNIYTGFPWSMDTTDLKTGESYVTDLTKLFVDPAHFDFHPKAGSPAINAGVDITDSLPVDTFPDYDFFKDIDGNPRPQGPGWDVGAYEYILNQIQMPNGECRIKELKNRSVFTNPCNFNQLYSFIRNSTLDIRNSSVLGLYDLNGHPVDINQLTQSGIYLIKTEGKNSLRKITLLK